MTLAFAVISIITYILLYGRPQDVQTAREIDATRYPTPAELSQLAAAGPQLRAPRREISIPNTSGPAGDFFLYITAPLAVFGGLHLLAWNYEFPTQVERKLWQASAVVTIVAFPIAGMTMRMYRQSRFAWYHDFLMFLAVFGSLGAFFAARVFILVEMVRSLAYQPPGTFRTTWAANVPHMG